MTFNPERDGWGLREAVMRTAGEQLLAKLHRDMIEAYSAGISFRRPIWWIYRLAPPPAPARAQPAPVEQLFIYDREGGVPLCLLSELGCNRLDIMLATGKLTCWARPAAPHADHVKVPWVSVMIEDWACGTLATCGFKGKRFVPIEGGVRYYDARIEKPGRQEESNKGGSPGHKCRDAAIAAAVGHLEAEGGEEEGTAVAETSRFITSWISQNVVDGGPSSPTTVREWAKKAIETCRAGKSSVT